MVASHGASCPLSLLHPSLLLSSLLFFLEYLPHPSLTTLALPSFIFAAPFALSCSSSLSSFLSFLHPPDGGSIILSLMFFVSRFSYLLLITLFLFSFYFLLFWGFFYLPFCGFTGLGVWLWSTVVVASCSLYLPSPFLLSFTILHTSPLIRHLVSPLFIFTITPCSHLIVPPSF